MYPLTTFLGLLLSSVTSVLAQSACSSDVTVDLRVEVAWDQRVARGVYRGILCMSPA